MNIETRQAYSEVYEILNLIGEDLSNKIPQKLRYFFERERDQEYIPNISKDIPIKEQRLKRKTIIIIAGLNLQYWCTNEEKKKELLEIYSNNELKLKEKYDIEKIFERNSSNKYVENNMQLVEIEKQKWYKKLLEKIKKIFNK